MCHWAMAGALQESQALLGRSVWQEARRAPPDGGVWIGQWAAAAMMRFEVKSNSRARCEEIPGHKVCYSQGACDGQRSAG